MSRLPQRAQECQSVGVQGGSADRQGELTPEVGEASPLGNTGALTREGVPDVTMLIDWVSLTFPEEHGAELVMSMVSHGEEWESRDYGTKGYTHSAQWGKLLCSWGGSAGIHVQASGQGCRQLEAIEGFSWYRWLAGARGMAAKVTRFDVAMDEKSGLLDLDTIDAALKVKACTSRAKRASYNGSYDAWEEGRAGRTLYIGKESSDSRIRIYDKAAEQGVEGHWNRCELQLRRRRATAAVDKFLEGGEMALAGVLRAALEFKEVTGKERIEEEEIAPWWAVFLEGAEKCVLKLEKCIQTAEKVMAWFERSMGPTMGMLSVWLGAGARQRLLQVADEGVRRLSARHRSILDASGVPRARYLEVAGAVA
jgi:phage replication initiation protein